MSDWALSYDDESNERLTREEKRDRRYVGNYLSMFTPVESVETCDSPRKKREAFSKSVEWKLLTIRHGCTLCFFVYQRKSVCQSLVECHDLRVSWGCSSGESVRRSFAQETGDTKDGSVATTSVGKRIDQQSSSPIPISSSSHYLYRLDVQPRRRCEQGFLDNRSSRRILCSVNSDESQSNLPDSSGDQRALVDIRIA